MAAVVAAQARVPAGECESYSSPPLGVVPEHRVQPAVGGCGHRRWLPRPSTQLREVGRSLSFGGCTSTGLLLQSRTCHTLPVILDHLGRPAGHFVVTGGRNLTEAAPVSTNHPDLLLPAPPGRRERDVATVRGIAGTFVRSKTKRELTNLVRREINNFDVVTRTCLRRIRDLVVWSWGPRWPVAVRLKGNPSETCPVDPDDIYLR